MGPLRLRSADRAPGLGTAELFGRTPESVLTDRDLSLGAKAMYGAITLAMIEARNPTVCLATVGELGRLLGIGERQARRLIADLERRGHVARERVRSISGSPQGIRPTAALRRARTRSDLSGCNRSDPSGGPDKVGRAPGQIRPGDRTGLTAPLKREGGKDLDSKKGASSPGERSRTARPTAAPEPGPEAQPDAEDLEAARAMLRDLIGRYGAWKSPEGPSAKIPPRGAARDSVPDERNCTDNPPNPSRQNDVGEHNDHT